MEEVGFRLDIMKTFFFYSKCGEILELLREVVEALLFKVFEARLDGYFRKQIKRCLTVAGEWTKSSSKVPCKLYHSMIGGFKINEICTGLVFTECGSSS